MTDLGFVLAAYGVVLGGLALYALNLGRRLAGARRARDESVGPRDEAG